MLKITELHPGRIGWQSLDRANCYQFAIGYREDLLDRELMPGSFPNDDIPDGYRYSDDELVSLVIRDLYRLGYEMKEIKETSGLNINTGEWLICILNCSKDNKEYYDFHFVAKFNSNESWYHKLTGNQFADPIDSPERGNYDFPYRIVGYYKIKKAEE